MSDIMRPIPFENLINWVLSEYHEKGSIFGVTRPVFRKDGQKLPIFKEAIESPFGPAAGPNTQLAQNIIASYVAGARFFELKTVQIMDGRELAACVPKPCIIADDECYNCEWSTELEVPQAYAEYVKAWVVLKIIAKEFGFGDPDGFVFNMSVGYDLKGIKSPKIDAYIEGMKDATKSEVWTGCIEGAIKALPYLKQVDEAYIRAISPNVSDSITESTLHGCPPDEIERIATYLIEEKHLNTYIKCNPTLLGYEFARERLDSLGFGYVTFDDHHFKEDLQWEDAVPMFRRLISLCEKEGLEFGVKLTNTFPVDVAHGELPSAEMYMAGRSLFTLTVELAKRVSREFDGALRISYSGGADMFNIRDLFDAGIWPITMATNILKPGGYQRFSQLADEFAGCGSEPFSKVDWEKVAALEEKALKSARYHKPVKPIPSRKTEEPLPLVDCFIAPCRTNCPISQDIPAYLKAMEDGRAEDALKIILERNALPFITGTICPHTCADKCMRNYYEEGLHIREVKLQAAEAAFGAVKPTLKKRGSSMKRVAIIGGGPAGLAAAEFISRAGAYVTVFEKQEQAGGVVRYAIPAFRISDEAIDKDVELAGIYGANIVTGCEIDSVESLMKGGFTDVVIAVGAWNPGRNALKYGRAIDALDFLAEDKKNPGTLDLGKNVVVIGGGNTAMDVARAAKREAGVEHVYLVYRRTSRYMPADEEELRMAIDDGVEFRELLAPIGVKDGLLTCSVMKLGEPDSSGRRSPVATGEEITIPADTVITAVGERINTSLYEGCGALLDEKGRPVVDDNLETTVPHVYAAGDARRGPATVVKAIADAQVIAKAITGTDFEGCVGTNVSDDPEFYIKKKGILEVKPDREPDDRCLGCPTVCEVCTDVCPNRANIAIDVPGKKMPQIIHMDGMCNECGNCAIFCPHAGRPYKDKFTLYWSKEDFENSENSGFLKVGDTYLVRLAGTVTEVNVHDPDSGLFDDLRRMILAVEESYPWLLIGG